MTDIDIERIVESVVASITAKTQGEGFDLSPDTVTLEVSLNQKDDVRHVALGVGSPAADGGTAVGTYLESLGYHVVNVTAGPGQDCVDIAAGVAKKVAGGECERGIVMDADGIASSIVCNKVKGIRAALCYDMRSTVNSREHFNANVMTVGGPFHNNAELCEMARTWLELRFSDGRRWATINKVMATEKSSPVT